MTDDRTRMASSTHDWTSAVDHDHLQAIRAQAAGYGGGGSAHLVLEDLRRLSTDPAASVDAHARRPSDVAALDHSEEAWLTHYAGREIQPHMVRVLCRPCNSRAGRSRPLGR